MNTPSVGFLSSCIALLASPVVPRITSQVNHMHAQPGLSTQLMLFFPCAFPSPLCSCGDQRRSKGRSSWAEAVPGLTKHPANPASMVILALKTHPAARSWAQQKGRKYSAVFSIEHTEMCEWVLYWHAFQMHLSGSSLLVPSRSFAGSGPVWLNYLADEVQLFRWRDTITVWFSLPAFWGESDDSNSEIEAALRPRNHNTSTDDFDDFYD